MLNTDLIHMLALLYISGLYHEHQCSRLLKLLHTKSVMQISGCQTRDEGLPENHRGALDMLESN